MNIGLFIYSRTPNERTPPPSTRNNILVFTGATAICFFAFDLLNLKFSDPHPRPELLRPPVYLERESSHISIV